MRHVYLTCKNHPELRWECKEIAFTDEGGYNGARNIRFCGWSTGRMHDDGSGLECTIIRLWPAAADEPVEVARECPCPGRDLIRAPEDASLQEIQKLKGNLS